MFVPASRGAYICARCQARRSLRSWEASFHIFNHYPTRLRQFHEDGTAPPGRHAKSRSPKKSYKWRSINPNGKVIGHGKQRKRERSERLSIKSLDQDSEVIVLRNIPEDAPEPVRNEGPATEEDELDQSGPGSSVIAAEDFLVTPTAKEVELFSAIEQHRPKGAIFRVTYKRLRNKLDSAFVCPQLKRYLKKHALQEKKAQSLGGGGGQQQDSQAKRTETPNAEAQKLQDPQDLLIRPWTKRPDRNAKPPTFSKPDKPKPVKLAKNLSKKATMLDRVLHTVWRVEVLEDREIIGELHIFPSSTQWELLQTRQPSDLFERLRQGLYFRKVSMEHDPNRGALYIRGPQQETEALADQFKTAFASCVSRKIDLKVMKTLLRSSVPSTMKAITEKAIDDVKHLTKTCINLSRGNGVIEIHGFTSRAVEDASRIITSMLNLKSVSSLHVIHDKCRFEQQLHPHQDRLPLLFKSLSMFRSHALLASDQASPILAEKQSRMKSLINRLHDNNTTMEDTTPHSTRDLWPQVGRPGSWRASFGSYLQEGSPDTREATPKGSKGQQASADKASVFQSSLPNAPTVVSWFQRLPSEKLQELDNTILEQLVAKLIPSPYGNSGNDDYLLYPHLEISFNVLRQQLDDSGDAIPSHSTSHRKSLALASIDAIFADQRIVHCLPDQATDLQISRRCVARADLSKLGEVADIKHFLDTVISSYDGQGELRAPAHLGSILVPSIRSGSPASGSPHRAKNGSGNKSGPATESDPSQHPPKEILYLFAGFEHRQSRRMMPVDKEKVHQHLDHKDVYTVTDVEAGIGGGKRMELVLEQGDKDINSFLQSAYRTTNFITLVQRGGIGTNFRTDWKPREDMASELDRPESKDSPDADFFHNSAASAALGSTSTPEKAAPASHKSRQAPVAVRYVSYDLEPHGPSRSDSEFIDDVD